MVISKTIKSPKGFKTSKNHVSAPKPKFEGQKFCQLLPISFFFSQIGIGSNWVEPP